MGTSWIDHLARLATTDRRRLFAALALTLLAPVGVSAGPPSPLPTCIKKNHRARYSADCCSRKRRHGRCHHNGNGFCLAAGSLPVGQTCEGGAPCCATCQTTFIDQGCGVGERCCEWANQPEDSLRGQCTEDCHCCAGVCVIPASATIGRCVS